MRVFFLFYAIIFIFALYTYYFVFFSGKYIGANNPHCFSHLVLIYIISTS